MSAVIFESPKKEKGRNNTRNITILAQTCLLGAALVPGKYYEPSQYRDRTPHELQTTEHRIIHRGYAIRGLREPREDEKELVERFSGLARKAGQPDAKLLIAVTNNAYAGVADGYVVLSEPIVKKFPAEEQDGFIGHELYHRKIEQERGKQYEDFTPEELKVIEEKADAFSYHLTGNADAVKNGLKHMQSYNEQAIFEEQPLLCRALEFNSEKQAIASRMEGEQPKHPATDKRIGDVDSLARADREAVHEAELARAKHIGRSPRVRQHMARNHMARSNISPGSS